MQYGLTVALGSLLVLLVVKPVLDAAEQSIITVATIIQEAGR